MSNIVEVDKFLSEVHQEVKKAYDDCEYEKAICCMKFLCSFYYEYDYKYYDDSIENYARKCAENCIGEIKIEASDKRKILFYDRFALYSRGLANIYIKALLSLGYEIIWCLFENGDEVGEILKCYENVENLKFELMPRGSVIERMYHLRKIILKINAYHNFIYTLPSDVECIGVFSVLKGDIRRYLINLTDHTFWIGACALDICIEFRNLGANISKKFRKIDESKIVILPFYPEKREQEEYQGLPFSEQDDFIFSGGQAYKIEGSNKFEQMVSGILDRHQNLKFLFITNDKSEKLDMLTLKYKNRFFVIKERSDLDEVYKRAKFYLSTYPWNGSLMVQYALKDHCTPLCLADKNNDFSNPSSWLLNREKIDFVFFEIEDLLICADQILSDDDTLGSQKICETFFISENGFVEELENVLKGKMTAYPFYEEDIHVEIFHSYYQNRLTPDSFRATVRHSNNKWLAEKYPGLFCE